ncbi:hypothetical protein L9F63_004334, partial [Diploptera punctata]
LLWVIVVLLGVMGAGFMVSSFWNRYTTTPTRASVETNHYPTWRVPFPAVTLCNSNKIFRSKAENLVAKLQLPEDMTRENAMNRLALLGDLIDPSPAKSEPFSFEQVMEFQDLLTAHNYTVRKLMKELGQSCSEMLVRCSWEGIIEDCNYLFEERKSYDGFCCSFNYRGVIEVVIDGKKMLTAAKRKVNYTRYYSHRMGLSVLLNPNMNDYFVSTMFSTGVRMLVHGADDFPDDTATEKILPVGRELLLRVTPTSGYCTDSVQDVSPEVRECVFESERKLHYFPIYSEINCIAECRMDYTIQFCNCSHFYYHDTGKIRLCELADIPCLRKYYYAMRTFEFGKTNMKCECPPLCNIVNYDVQYSSGNFQAKQYQVTPFFNNITNVTGQTLFHFYYGSHVSIRTRRDIINSWNDLLSSLGGIFSLFLGCSLISGVEVLYYFTLRLFVRLKLGLLEKSAITHLQNVKPWTGPHTTRVGPATIK